MTFRPVTVVIPVYADRESLLECLEAVLATVDRSRHTVLLVNDCGPEADRIEREILQRIADEAGVRYERNQRNLGFVGTCNRAARELSDPATDVVLLNSDTVPTPGWLETLAAAIAADPRNGMACARSNAATIATLPFRRRDPGVPLTRDRTAQVHAAVRDWLPPYSVTPVAMGFCFYVRREVIDRFGLFDEAFAPGYGEENDLCLRAGREGVRSLIVHGALVFHAAGASFGARRTRLRARHELLLMRRHPGYHAAVRRYLTVESDPVDVFADALVPDGAAPAIVIDCDRPLDAVERAVISGIPGLTLRARTRAVRRAARSTGLPVVGEDPGPRIWDIAITLGEAQPDRLLAPRRARGSGDRLADVLRAAAEQASRPVDLEELRRVWAEPSWLAPDRGRGLRARLRLRLDAAAPFLTRAAAGARRRLRDAVGAAHPL